MLWLNKEMQFSKSKLSWEFSEGFPTKVASSKVTKEIVMFGLILYNGLNMVCPIWNPCWHLIPIAAETFRGGTIKGDCHDWILLVSLERGGDLIVPFMASCLCPQEDQTCEPKTNALYSPSLRYCVITNTKWTKTTYNETLAQGSVNSTGNKEPENLQDWRFGKNSVPLCSLCGTEEMAPIWTVGG
jgi:hypothetical protein